MFLEEECGNTNHARAVLTGTDCIKEPVLNQEVGRREGTANSADDTQLLK